VREKNFTNFDKKKLLEIKQLLDKEVEKRDSVLEVSKDKLDPIFVAKKFQDPTISLICALFSYGNVTQIVKFLESLDFSLLQKDEENIQEFLQSHYYRFQKSDDIVALFIALKRLGKKQSLEEIFSEGYCKNKSILDGIDFMIKAIRSEFHHESRGYTFLLSTISQRTKGAGTLKRWMMYLRWMIRKDNIDLGLWDKKYIEDLIIPLDTHTFHVARKLGLLKRKTYDLEAAIELTEVLKIFDFKDPVKYDFALYRLGQEKLV